MKSGRQGIVQDYKSDTSMAARKFYAQRNVYLTGFCLFLSLVLTRTFYITLDLLQTQEQYAKLKKAGGSSEDQSKEIANLKKQLEQTKRDNDIVKKQASQNYAEYDRLATELNDLSGNKSDKRKD